MQENRRFCLEFLDFMVESGALLFGEFTLKSGRKSPYFINTGEYKTGAQLSKLGEFYAKLIRNSVCSHQERDAGGETEALGEHESERVNALISSKFNVLFGPAYKGIPLVTATSAKLADDGLSLYVSFNRKERKDHGEGSLIMGYRPQPGDRIAIIEDVTTSGSSVRETAALLDDLGIDASIVALYISIDRMERGTGDESAISQLKREYGIDIYAIATAADIVDYLETPPTSRPPILNAAALASDMRAYLAEYGA